MLPRVASFLSSHLYFSFSLLDRWDFFTCGYDRLSVHWPLLLYKPDASSKARQALHCFARVHSLLALFHLSHQKGWDQIGSEAFSRFLTHSPETSFFLVFIKINPLSCCDNLISPSLWATWNNTASDRGSFSFISPTPTCRIYYLAYFKTMQEQSSASSRL